MTHKKLTTMEIFLAFGLGKFALVGNTFPTQNLLWLSNLLVD